MTTTAPRKRNVHDVLTALEDRQQKTLLIRVDFNVPMNEAGEITDDSRIRGALPTIQLVTKAGCNAVLVSHMGRPKKVQATGDLAEKAKLSLRPVAQHLAKLLDQKVEFADDCLTAADQVKELRGGQICVLENLRFYKQEEKNDKEFAQTLASYADGYINDAFGTAHRAHASTHGVPDCMADKSLCGIGLLVQSELAYLDFTKTDPTMKITAIIGGSKVSTKLPVIQGLLKTVDSLILGGGLAFTFLKAKGINIGTSLLEESMLDTAKELMQQAEANGVTIYLPVDSVCSQSFPSGPMDPADTKTFELNTESGGIPDGWMGLDCGPQTIQTFVKALEESTKICFNGPMGVFEVTPFDVGTRTLVDQLVRVTAEPYKVTTVVGGGDSVAALKAFGKTKEVSYVSTGGGATLELLAGDKLPGVEIIPTV